MTNPRHNHTDRVGVYKIASIVEGELNWVFRERSVSDVGIDAVFEKAINGNPQRLYLDVQIKAGDSVFQEVKGGFAYYNIKDVQYNYWANGYIPVIIIYWCPKLEQAFWNELSYETMKRNSNGNKYQVRIDKEFIFGVKDKDKLEQLINTPRSSESIRFYSFPNDSELSEKEVKGDGKEVNINATLTRGSESLSQANLFMGRMSNGLSEYMKSQESVLKKLLGIRNSAGQMPEMKLNAAIDEWAISINLISSILDQNVPDFSLHYADALINYRKAIEAQLESSVEVFKISSTVNGVLTMGGKFDTIIDLLKQFQGAFMTGLNKSVNYKTAGENAVKSAGGAIEELQASKDLTSMFKVFL